MRSVGNGRGLHGAVLLFLFAAQVLVKYVCCQNEHNSYMRMQRRFQHKGCYIAGMTSCDVIGRTCMPALAWDMVGRYV